MMKSWAYDAAGYSFEISELAGEDMAVVLYYDSDGEVDFVGFVFGVPINENSPEIDQVDACIASWLLTR